MHMQAWGIYKGQMDSSGEKINGQEEGEGDKDNHKRVIPKIQNEFRKIQCIYSNLIAPRAKI